MLTNLPVQFNKEIYLLRLTVTTECILDCRYCFVYKNNQTITYPVAMKAITLFLNSPGNQKLLMLYGGEPLLKFKLVKRIINFAQKKAKSVKKSLSISLGTNGILLNQRQLSFFKKAKVGLAISLDGRKDYHDKNRVFSSQKGSFDAVLDKLPLALKNIKQEKLCALFGVLPALADKIYNNLLYLTDLGFSSINIEPICSRRFSWSIKQKECFQKGMVKLRKYIYGNIKRGNFIFLNTVNRELKDKRISSRDKECPFFGSLEVHPDGGLAFSPFLINSKDKEKYIIGNIQGGLKNKYRFCKHDPGCAQCRQCWRNYSSNEVQTEATKGVNFNKVLQIRDSCSVDLAREVLKKAKSDPIFKEYVQEAKKRIFE